MMSMEATATECPLSLNMEASNYNSISADNRQLLGRPKVLPRRGSRAGLEWFPKKALIKARLSKVLEIIGFFAGGGARATLNQRFPKPGLSLTQLLKEQADRFNPVVEVRNMELLVRGVEVVVRKAEAHHHRRNLQHVLEIGDDRN